MRIVLGIMCGLMLLLCGFLLKILVLGLFGVAMGFFVQWMTGVDVSAAVAMLGDFIPADWPSYLGYVAVAPFVLGIMAVLNTMAVRALMGNVPGRPWHFAALAMIDVLMFVAGVTLPAFVGYRIVLYFFSAFMLVKGLLCLDQAWRIWSADGEGRRRGESRKDCSNRHFVR